MVTTILKNLYQSYVGQPAEDITELPSSGSNRRYFRLTGPQTLIGVSGTASFRCNRKRAEKLCIR